MVVLTEVAGAIDGDYEVTLKTEIIQSFHADQPAGVLVKQLGEGGAADVPNKVIQSFGDRQGILLRARQVVEVVEDGAFQVAQSLSAERQLPKPSPKRSNSHQQRKRRRDCTMGS